MADATLSVLPRLLNAQELAAATGVARWRIYELTRLGALPHVRLGRTVRYDPAAVMDWLRAGGTAAARLDA